MQGNAETMEGGKDSLTGKSAFIYHDEFLKYQFGPDHPFQPIRDKHALDILKRLEIFGGKAQIYEPERATLDELRLVHTEKYIHYVEEMCKGGSGLLDSGDTPAAKGLFEGALRVVGGSILGAKLILEGKVDHAFNPGGGLHHAKAGRASGFCVFNDIAVTVRYLQRNCGIKRIAVVDVDGHHGDGTQQIFYDEPILKISSHRIGIFPGTGYVEEMGVGEGRGYSVNIPLQGGTGDEAYLYAFHEIVPPLLKSYRPEIIINQFGIDGHYQDPLVGLSLTTKTYEKVAETMHSLAHELCSGKLLVLGGGGYDIENTAKCWAIMFATICGCLNQKHLSDYRNLFDNSTSQEDEYATEAAKKTVERIKKTIFPLHHITM